MGLGQLHSVRHAHRREKFPGIEVMPYFFEYPRMTICGPSYHNPVHAVALEGSLGLDGVGNIPITYYRYVHTGVLLDFAYEGPVCLSLVHLGTGAAVDGESLYAHILQPFGQLDNDFAVLIVTQAGLYGDWQFDGLDHGLSDCHQFVRLAKHSAPCAPTGDFLDRTAEVDVHKIGPVASCYLCCALDHTGGFHHGLWNVTVNLQTYGCLEIIGAHFGNGFGSISNKAIGRDEFGIDHIRSILFAYPAESGVRDVFHRGEEQRPGAQIYLISYLHAQVLQQLNVFGILTLWANVLKITEANVHKNGGFH